jgi:hypothetical protein
LCQIVQNVPKSLRHPVENFILTQVFYPIDRFQLGRLRNQSYFNKDQKIGYRDSVYVFAICDLPRLYK